MKKDAISVRFEEENAPQAPLRPALRTIERFKEKYSRNHREGARPRAPRRPRTAALPATHYLMLVAF